MTVASQFVGYAFRENQPENMWRALLVSGRFKINLGRHGCKELAEIEIRSAIRDLRHATETFEANEDIRAEPPAKPKHEPPVWTNEECQDEVLQSVNRLIDCPLDGKQRDFIERLRATVQTDDFRISVRQLDWLRRIAAAKLDFIEV